MKKHVKAIISVAVLIFALTLCGCERASLELSDMMIIQGLGIDYENGEITATAEMLNNLDGGSAGEGNTTPKKTVVFSAKGKTISEAVNNIALKCGKEPLYAHIKVVVLGERAADKNMADVLDFFERDYNTKPSMLICIAKGCTANEMLSARLANGGVKSELIENVLKTGNEMSRTLKVRVSEAVCVTKEKESSLVLPAVSLEKSGEESEYMLSGCAVFNKDNTVCSYIDDNMSSSLIFLENKVNKGSFTATLSDGAEVSMLIVNSETRYFAEIENGVPVFNIRIKVRADLNEFSNGVFEKLDFSAIEEIEAAAKAELEKDVSNCIRVLRDDLSCDAARFTKMLSLKKPKYFSSLGEAEKEEIYKKSEFNVSAEVTIRRTGDEGFDFS